MVEILLFFCFLILALLLVVRSAHYANHYSTRIALAFNLPKYVIGFLVVAVISVLPEFFISLTSALEGIPAFGLGTLFGSNVADLTLILGLVVLISGRKLKVERKILHHSSIYIGAMLLPLIFGLNGYYSRTEGIFLILVGLSYYYFSLKRGNPLSQKVRQENYSLMDVIFLVLSMAGLLIGAHFTVIYGVHVAQTLNISPILIGMFVVGLGTTLPELFFCLKAVKNRHDSLAFGDILGTVIADATIIVGMIATISPFIFDKKIVYVTGVFMILATMLLFYFMKTERRLTKIEALGLLLFYMIFVCTELILGNI